MVADSFLSLIPRIRAQPEHVIIDKTRASKRLRKLFNLLRIWVETKLICSLDAHGLNNTTIPFKGQH